MDKADRLLGCALTYREAGLRAVPVADTFSDADEAVSVFADVLLHEAHEALQDPLQLPPDQPYMHPVDIETDEPGIVDQKDKLHIRRASGPLPRAVYPLPKTGSKASVDRPRSSPTSSSLPSPHAPSPLPSDVARSEEEAARLAQKSLARTLAKAERRAASSLERSDATRARKEARANETGDEREARLAEARRKREAKRQEREARAILETAGPTVSTTPPPPPPPPPSSTSTSKKRPPPLPSEDALLTADASTSHLKPPRRRVPGGKVRFYAHPLPHHRHLEALQTARPHDVLLPALLRGEAVDELAVVQGPPGTGKTSELVRLLKAVVRPDARVYLCAPTNVGAANLYARCLSEGLGDEASLALAADRVPAGTSVRSNDPTRRVVCGTVSGRAGPTLTCRSFDVVMVDEAAQCMEAWIWGLLRPEVTSLFLAGDVKQLPACASESGVRLRHERSLMERLASLSYENTTELTVQNRMCPELLAFPNAVLYGGALSTGPAAPPSGVLRVVDVEDGEEEGIGPSFRNRREAAEAMRHARALADELGADKVVVVAPYAAQCGLLLADRSGIPVHTIDSFQGRESEAVVLSCVRDGSTGLGFWNDARRVAVALTRARTRLTVVASRVGSWPDGAALASFLRASSIGGPYDDTVRTP